MTPDNINKNAMLKQGYKPTLGFWQIVNMNVGFFGIQFSFGLQQSNMSPIYNYLGANQADLPYLWLAGPVTGLLVQPLIGAMSDKTVSQWGKRTPYFFIGALICSLGLLAMPFSPTLWMAASLLWILDAANNVTMEPYRAYVSDQLNATQTNWGFLIQSAFTGLGQTLAYLTPFLLFSLGISPHWTNAHGIPYITVFAFLLGAFFSISSVLWSMKTSPEAPSLALDTQPKSAVSPHRQIMLDIWQALIEMPVQLRQMAWMMLFQWYAMFCYWQYITLSLSLSFFGTTDGHSDAFREAGLINAKIGGFYNFVAFLSAFMLMPVVARFGPKRTHAVCIALAGIAMWLLPAIQNQTLLFVPMLAIGLAWASMMGNPYSMLAHAIPQHRVGVYMGIFNMFIVLPMFIQIMTLPLFFNGWLSGNPQNVIRLAGGLLLLAALATWRVQDDASSMKRAIYA